MSEARNIAGEVFGRLKVLRKVGTSRHRSSLWECLCSCGTIVVKLGSNLWNKNTFSCGCMAREKDYKHGHSKRGHQTREYLSWINAKTRCFNGRISGAKHYSARGITMCDRWRDSFSAFLEDMGPRPPDTSIDRIDPNGNYEPGNCRWATDLVQNNNTRRTNLRRMAI